MARKRKAAYKPYAPPIQRPPAGGWTDWLAQTGRAGTPPGEGPGYTLQGAFQAGQLSPAGLTNLFPEPVQVTIPGQGNPLTQAAIEADPIYQAALGDIAGADVLDEQEWGTQLANAAIGYGGDLSSLLAGGLISAQTAEQARANPFSTMAGLARQLQQGTSRGVDELAARGILNSGAFPSLAAQLNQGYQAATNQATSEFGNLVSTGRGNVARARQERRAGLTPVREQVAGRLSQSPQYANYTPAMQATWKPDVGAYVDSWGRKFNVKGEFVGYV